MVSEKQMPTKSKTIHAVEPDSSIPTESSSYIDEQIDLQGSEEHGKEVTNEKRVQPKKHDEKFTEAKAKSDEEDLEGSPLPPLPKERDAKRPSITSFFLKTLVKKTPTSAEPTKETRGQKQGEQKKAEERKKKQEKENNEEDEEHTPMSKRITTQKQDARKMVPRKFTRLTSTNVSQEPLVQSLSVSKATSQKKATEERIEEVEADLTQKQARAGTNKKALARGKQAQMQKETTEEQDKHKQGQDIVEETSQLATDKATNKKRKTMAKKLKDPDTTPKKKWRTELDQLDKLIIKETRTRGRQIEESPIAPSKGKSKVQTEKREKTKG